MNGKNTGSTVAIFCRKPHIWHDYLQGRFSKLIKETLQHNGRLNCLCNAITPQSCHPTFVVYTYWHWWKHKLSKTRFTAIGLNNTNILMLKVSKMARQNFILLSQSMKNYFSSIGIVFYPHCGGGGKWRPFRFRPPFWMTSFPVPQMRSSKMAAGSGRAAILLHLHNGGRKTLTKSWLTSFPVPPSWESSWWRHK